VIVAYVLVLHHVLQVTYEARSAQVICRGGYDRLVHVEGYPER
jgi:hypothetical protein